MENLSPRLLAALRFVSVVPRLRPLRPAAEEYIAMNAR